MPWKWVLNILAILIVLLIATSYVILTTYDFNKFKPEIIQDVKNATGRDLRLEGDLDLAIGLTPALVVQNVGFQNALWGSRPEMARIKRLEVQVRVLPLVRGKIEVKRFVLVEPDLLIETHKSGRSNLEFKRAKTLSPEGPETGESETGQKILSMLTFNDLRIEKGRLTYKHGPSGRSYALSVANLTLGAPNNEAPVDLRLKGSYKSRTLDASGTLGPLALLFDPDKRWPLKLTVDLAGARFSVDGAIKNALLPRDFDFTVTAQGRSLSDVARMVGAVNLPEVGPFNGTARLHDRAGRLSIEDLRL
ncbi:MAG: AsmA family protein, partial [Desulfobacterales bacterium]|nr:AsmA family protein [Desulfobacterales bacterium]